jgi:hypothetical protein
LPQLGQRIPNARRQLPQRRQLLLLGRNAGLLLF